jgi:Flp pilus assembly protein TadG
MPKPRAKSRGQVVVLTAIIFPVILLMVFVFLALSTLYSARSHARQSLQVATAAGAREIDYSSLKGDRVRLDEARAITTTRTVFENALSLYSFGMGDTANHIAQSAHIEVHNEVPWTSPHTGTIHESATVAATAEIPVKILVFKVRVRVTVETEAHTP